MPIWFVLALLGVLGSLESTTAQLVDYSDISITCDPNGVEITVNGTGLEEAVESLNLDTLRIGSGKSSDCLARQQEEPLGRGLKLFKFAYGECNPEVEDFTDTQLRLLYHVTGDKRSDDSPDGDTNTSGGTTVSCFIPKDGLIAARIADHTKVYEYVGNVEGQIRFEMTLYKDSFMTAPVENEDQIPLGIPLWVKLKMFHRGNADLFVKDCWATPAPTKSLDQPEHVFIKKGIIGDDDETFAPNDDVITATTYGFSFDSFMFRGSGSRVYVKCNVHVCNPSDAESDKDSCSIPKYPEFQVSARDLGELGSGSGSGNGILNFGTRDLNDNGQQEEFDDNGDDNFGEEMDDDNGNGMMQEMLDDDNILTDAHVMNELPMYYVMHSFNVKHAERKRRSAGSYRIYPRHTMFSNLRSGITLGIIIASTAMISACAILLPLHFSGEKVRCLHMKAIKRTI